MKDRICGISQVLNIKIILVPSDFFFYFLFWSYAVQAKCVFLAGVSLPSHIAGEKHVRAGEVPDHAWAGPNRTRPRSGGAAQNPRFPGAVSSGLPVRTQPHAFSWNEGVHGPDRDLDVRAVKSWLQTHTHGGELECLDSPRMLMKSLMIIRNQTSNSAGHLKIAQQNHYSVKSFCLLVVGYVQGSIFCVPVLRKPVDFRESFSPLGVETFQTWKETSCLFKGPRIRRSRNLSKN